MTSAVLITLFAAGCVPLAKATPIKIKPGLDTQPALAVGRLLRDGKFQCTAFHIGEGRVLTAGHCVMFECHLDGATSMNTLTVQWPAANNEGPVSTVTKVHSCANTASLDFAVLEVSDPPGVKLELNADSSEPGSPPPPTALKVITWVDGKTLTLVDACTTWKLDGGDLQKQYNFSHTCKVSKGSSGSPVMLDASGVVVGIHTGGTGVEHAMRVRESGFRGLNPPP